MNIFSAIEAHSEIGVNRYETQSDYVYEPHQVPHTAKSHSTTE